MNNQDWPKLQNMLNGLGEYYQQKEPLTKMAIDIYFGALIKYDFETIRKAAMQYVSTARSSQFTPKIPKASDIILIIDGGSITKDEVLAAARAKNTVLGVLSCIVIGTHDLNNSTNMEYLKSRAQECIDLTPEWREKARTNSYTPHELAVMRKYGVQPSSSLTGSVAIQYDTTGDDSTAYLKLMSSEVKPLPECTKAETDDNHKRVMGILKEVLNG